MQQGRVKITPELQKEILRIHESEPGGWRAFPEKLDGKSWPGTWGLAQQIAGGYIQSTNPLVYDCLGLDRPPAILHIEIPAGTPLFSQGKTGILGDIGVVLIEDSGLEGAGLLLVPKDMAALINQASDTIKEGLKILNRLPTRECRHPDCSVRFPALYGRVWCTSHDWESGYQRTHDGQAVRVATL